MVDSVTSPPKKRFNVAVWVSVAVARLCCRPGLGRHGGDGRGFQRDGASGESSPKMVVFLVVTRPGKHTKNDGKSPLFIGKSSISMENIQTTMENPPFLMGKLTISTGPFSIANC